MVYKHNNMDKIIYYGSIGLMCLGLVAILSAFPMGLQSTVVVGPISAEVSEVSATRIIVGVVLMALGFFGYNKSK